VLAENAVQSPGQPCYILLPLRLPFLQNAKAKREAIGVELYGFQQNLAKLQLSLEQTHQNYQIISKVRAQVCHTACIAMV
jgi:nitrate reductase assembly molybdenum cofactor insertion protein NarJ